MTAFVLFDRPLAMPISVESLRVFISQLAARPGMWVGLPASVGEFAAAIVGYEAALCDAGIVKHEASFGREFSRWLAAGWRVSPVVGWDAHIEERFGDEEAGIAEAAKLIEQWFRTRR